MFLRRSKRRLGPKSQVVVVLDVSTSVSAWGKLADEVRKVLLCGLAMDHKGEIPAYGFAWRAWRIREQITSSTLDAFIQKHCRRNWFALSGTDFHAPMRLVLEDVKQRRRRNLPVYVLFFTDGEALDKEKTLGILKEVRGLPIFWMFVEVRKGFSLIPSPTPNCLGELERLDNVGLIRLSKLRGKKDLQEMLTKECRHFLG